MTDDITAALIEHARSSLQYEKQLLRELEALKGDVNAANQKHAPPKPNGYPKPTIIPPLEDDTQPSIKAIATAPPGQRSFTGFPSGTPPTTQAVVRPHSAVPQSPSAGPSTARNSAVSPSASISGPSRGGRFGDGTQSMFVKSTPPSFGPSAGSSSSSSSLPQGPLGNTVQTSTPTPSQPSHPLAGADPLSASSVPSTNTQILDPLAHLAPVNMSQSVRMQPSRPRLDARVAASKLSNMF